MKSLNLCRHAIAFLFILQMTFGPARAETIIGETSGQIDWSGWTLDYQAFANNDGLSLLDVAYDGIPIINQASFPVMSVYYQDNVCGPYADRLNGPMSPVEWADSPSIVAREFTQDGKRWLELGIREFIGSYDIYQVWFLSGDGELVGHIFSRGLQCNEFHEHYPMWRIDFDIDGSQNDQILKRTSSTEFEVMPTEFESSFRDAYADNWYIQDTETDRGVSFQFDSGGWTGPSPNDPTQRPYGVMLAGLRYSVNEKFWTGGPRKTLSFDDGQSINSQDVVVWFSGYLPHFVEDGASLWHSTGFRATVDAVDSDGDGTPNILDQDDDNDGTVDLLDDLPLDPDEQVDTDFDGIGNNSDLDDDGDGYPDVNDALPLDASEWEDSDNDSIGEIADIDDDNDGLTDFAENQTDATQQFYVFSESETLPGSDSSITRTFDYSSSGLSIGAEVKISDIQAYGDLNSTVETFDLIFNGGEKTLSGLRTGAQCKGLQPVLNSPETTVRLIDIGNGKPGVTIKATSSAAVNLICAESTYALTIAHEVDLSLDSDGDGVVNRLDLDSDNDGALDVSEGGGNDSDGDGIINNPASNQGTIAAPPDTDSDSIPDFLDLESTNASNNSTNFDIVNAGYSHIDTNGDGTVNAGDADGGTDDNGNGIDDAIEGDSVDLTDSDGDGIIDSVDPDDDNDGVEDTEDAFPLDPTESLDTDGDGIGNNADTDDDGDGVPDIDDLDPLDPNVGRATNTVITPGQVESGSVLLRAWHYFDLAVDSAVSEYRFDLSSIDNDADLYVRYAENPDANQYDCRSNRSGTSNEDCTLSSAGHNKIVIGVYGNQESSYSLRVTEVTDSSDEILEVGSTDSVNLAESEWVYYQAQSVNNVTSAVATLTNLSADIDLYVRYGAKPTTATYDCRSWASGTSSETCDVDFTTSEDVYIGVYGYRAGTGTLTLDPVATTGGGGSGTIQPGEQISDSVLRGEYKYYTIDNPNGVNNLSAYLQQLEADVDLLTKVGGQPTLNDNDCVSDRGSVAEEVCEVSLSASTTHIGVYGYRESAFTLDLIDMDNGPDELRPDQFDQNTIGSKAWRFYRILGHSGASSPEARITNLSHDIDLYINTGSLPSTQDYTCRSRKGGTSIDACLIPTNTNDAIYVGIFGFKSGTYRLDINSVALGAATEEISHHRQINTEDKVESGKWRYYKITTDSGDNRLMAELTKSSNTHLFLRRGEKPTDDEFDCGPDFYSDGENICHLNLPSTGESQIWYAGIYSDPGSAYKLLVNASNEELDENGDLVTSAGDTQDGPVTTGGAPSPLLLLWLTSLMLIREMRKRQAQRRRSVVCS